jgi:putative alpha-1,2-mannosidase
MQGCPGDEINNCPIREKFIAYDSKSLKATPGYFSITLANGIKAEMTAANRTALYKFHFAPAFNVSDTARFGPAFSIELSDLPGTRKEGGAVVDAQTGRIHGNGTFNPSFGIGTYTSYFCMDFQGAKIRDAGVWKNTKAGKAPAVRVVPDGVNGNNAPGLQAGTWIRFFPGLNGTTVNIRVGLSFISERRACENAEREVPDFGFERVYKENVAAWKQKLSPIEVDAFGVNEDLQKTFWSGIYRNFISPQDYTGENPLWRSTEPYYDSYYCIWDSYRSMHQLLTLMDPHSQTLMVRSLIDIYRHEGYLPDCRMSLCKGFTQGGSNADTLLVDSWLKGIEDGVDWETGYRAMVKDAEVEPINWSVEGRGGLDSWKSLGYIPMDDFDPLGSGAFTRSISRTVEYAYNDYCIGVMANLTGRRDDYVKYINNSHNWKNLWKAEQTSLVRGADTGFVGFLQPRLSNGTWDYQDPVVCSHELNFDGCYLNPTGSETYEGSPWLYTLYVPGMYSSFSSITFSILI